MIATLQSLQQALELPELFMKSEEEKAIWQLVRRVSDQIKINIDHSKFDRAERIQQYDRFRARREVVTVSSGHNRYSINSDLFYNPTSVYKIYIKELELKL
jgi:hypothetical protein